MASLLAGALKLGPAVIDGLTHEQHEMKRDSTPFSFKRIGHGFKAFGEGFADSIMGREPNNHQSTRGNQLNAR